MKTLLGHVLDEIPDSFIHKKVGDTGGPVLEEVSLSDSWSFNATVIEAETPTRRLMRFH